MMGMVSNGFKTSKSGSPVTMQSALAERASSRYLLSSGSRQIFTRCVTCTITAKDSYSLINSSLNSLLKYLSNLDLITTFSSSVKVKIDINITSAFLAFSNACPDEEASFKSALISTLQSRTIFTYFSLSSCSNISGVSPFLRACSLASFIISSRLLFLPTSKSNVSAIDFFSATDILLNFSAVVSFTSSVIVFINQS